MVQYRILNNNRLDLETEISDYSRKGWTIHPESLRVHANSTMTIIISKDFSNEVK